MGTVGGGVTIEEVAPGVYRLPFAVGTKPLAMYVLAGDGLTLIDTGLTDTPEAIYLPAIAELGRRPDEVRLVLITHADADHIGGDRAARTLFPHALLACHAADARWVADPAVLSAERYDGFRPFGLRYDDETFATLDGWMFSGRPEPADLLFQGGERIRLAGDDWLDVVHVPGHTAGHLALHNPAGGYALIGDAVFGASQLDTGGAKAAAPPYVAVAPYRATVDRLAALGIGTLLTCHYPVMRGGEVGAFLAESRAWADRAEAAIEEALREAAAPLTLGEAIERTDPELGPFQNPRELQWALRAHLEQAAARGRARAVDHSGITAWVHAGA